MSDLMQERIDQLSGLLREARSHVVRAFDADIEFWADNPLLLNIDAALAGKLPAPRVIEPDNLRSHRDSWQRALAQLIELEPHPADREYWEHELRAMQAMYLDLDRLTAGRDTEWTDGEDSAASSQFLSVVDAWLAGDHAKPTLGDYRELQAQHDQLQSKYKAALDFVRDSEPVLSSAIEAFNWECGGVGEDDARELHGRIGALLGDQVPAMLEGWQLVPFTPTEDQWGGLARAIIFWMRSYPSNQHTPRTLVEFITSLGHAVPGWMDEEGELKAQDHVMSKGTIAVLIYKAMLAAAPKPEGAA